MQFSKEDNKAGVLIVAPSLDILGGQSVQAARLLDRLRQEPGLEVGFCRSIRVCRVFGESCKSVKYVRTVVTSIAYFASLFGRVWKYDVIHIFSASYFSFVLAPTPALLIGKLFRQEVIAQLSQR